MSEWDAKIREYGDGLPVKIMYYKKSKRLVIYAVNEAGYNCTCVDFFDVIEFYKENKEILENLQLEYGEIS